MELNGTLSFLERQFKFIQNGGWPALKYKLNLLNRSLKKKAITLLLFPFFGVPVIFIRFLSPWLKIRFGELESSGIGHLALPIEIYLSEIDQGLHHPGRKMKNPTASSGVSRMNDLSPQVAGNKTPSGGFKDIWCTQKIISNHLLLEKWSLYLTIWPRWIVKPMILVNDLIPGGHTNRIPYRYIYQQTRPWQFCDINGVLPTSKIHINFSEEEKKEGFETLKKMGIEKNDRYLCFMTRDGAYYSEQHDQWAHRNSSIHPMAQALEYFGLKKKYKFIRMGAKVIEKLNTNNSSFIDYAANGMRTELLDLFLIAHCHFMVSTATGLDSLASAFRRSVVYVNLADFGTADVWGENTLFIPKKLWSITEKRFLTFSEIFKIGAHFFGETWQYKKAGIEWIDNEVEEIQAAVSEMEQRLSQTWISYPEDEKLQNKFRSLWPTRSAGLKILKSRIGTEFLRRNQGLLQ